MRDNSVDHPSVRRQGLFPCEAEVARRLSQSEKRWRHIVRQLEREGLRRIDPIVGRRFEFFNRSVLPDEERRA